MYLCIVPLTFMLLEINVVYYIPIIIIIRLIKIMSISVACMILESSNVPVSGRLIQEKDSQIAVELNINEFRHQMVGFITSIRDITSVRYSLKERGEVLIRTLLMHSRFVWLRDMRRKIFTIWMKVGYFGIRHRIRYVYIYTCKLSVNPVDYPWVDPH